MPNIKLVNGKEFGCAQGQSILEAANIQDIILNYGCKSGRCGACKAQLLAGEVEEISPQLSLSERDREGDQVLTCCCSPVSDVCLGVEDLGAVFKFKPKVLPCRIDNIEMLSHDVVQVVLRIPPNSRFEYLAGQYIDVIGIGGCRRSYSIANAPAGSCRLMLQIRRVEGGLMSQYWFDEAKLNDLLRIEGPFGTFFYREGGPSNIIFLATGTGFAPIRAMLEAFGSNLDGVRDKDICFYWGGRCKSDLYMNPETLEIPFTYKPVISRSSTDGRGKEYVQDVVVQDFPNLDDSVVYACGSEKMIKSAKEKLENYGLQSNNFHFDAFVTSS